jgi:hypothetical protein
VDSREHQKSFLQILSNGMVERLSLQLANRASKSGNSGMANHHRAHQETTRVFLYRDKVSPYYREEVCQRLSGMKDRNQKIGFRKGEVDSVNIWKHNLGAVFRQSLQLDAGTPHLVCHHKSEKNMVRQTYSQYVYRKCRIRTNAPDGKLSKAVLMP